MSEQLSVNEAWAFLKEVTKRGTNSLSKEELAKYQECRKITLNARNPPSVYTRYQVVDHETFGGTTYRITKELDITITDICEMSDDDILKLLDIKSTLAYIRSTLI
jgi:hypothetical protein